VTPNGVKKTERKMDPETKTSNKKDECHPSGKQQGVEYVRRTRDFGEGEKTGKCKQGVKKTENLRRRGLEKKPKKDDEHSYGQAKKSSPWRTSNYQ